MWVLAKLTIREALAKRILIAFILINTLFLIILLTAFNVDIVQGNQGALEFFGKQSPRNDIPIDEVVTGTLATASSGLMLFGIFISIFATAGLIPSMLEKGTIDLVLAKPLSRLQIISGRTLGALLIVFVNMTYLILGIWLILGVKTGFWMFDLLTVIPLICLMFLIIYSWMVMFGLLLRNTSLTIMLTYLLYALNVALMFRDQIYALLNGKFWGYFLDGLFYLLPRTAEMIAYPVDVFMRGEELSLEPFITSSIVSIIVFIGAMWIFQKKDF